VEVVALVDTGFSEFLLLPSRCVEDLGLAELPDADTLRLADDTEATFRLYECAVVWADEERAVVVHAAEASPLVGMALLWQHRLTVDVEINGALTIEPLM
jgi:clan AA aspartic protease